MRKLDNHFSSGGSRYSWAVRPRSIILNRNSCGFEMFKSSRKSRSGEFAASSYRQYQSQDRRVRGNGGGTRKGANDRERIGRDGPGRRDGGMEGRMDGWRVGDGGGAMGG
jgi:hypothetical protein